VRRPGAVFASTLIALVTGGLLLATCSSPGDSCQSDSDCGGDLICAKPDVDGGPAESGACTHKAAGPGELCRVADDCAGGLFCSNELPSAVKRLDGNCIPPRDEGQSCANNDQCNPPLECLLTAEGDGTCDAPPVSDAGADAETDTASDAAALSSRCQGSEKSAYVPRNTG
jgi:hypothetical protein